MGRPEGPPTKTVTIVLSKGTHKRLQKLAVDAEMPVSSYIRKDLEHRYPEEHVFVSGIPEEKTAN